MGDFSTYKIYAKSAPAALSAALSAAQGAPASAEGASYRHVGGCHGAAGRDGRTGALVLSPSRAGGTVWHCHAGCSQAQVGSWLHGLLGWQERRRRERKSKPAASNPAPVKSTVKQPVRRGWRATEIPQTVCPRCGVDVRVREDGASGLPLLTCRTECAVTYGELHAGVVDRAGPAGWTQRYAYRTASDNRTCHVYRRDVTGAPKQMRREPGFKGAFAPLCSLRAGMPTVVVEGEKAAAAVLSAGLGALCWQGGTGQVGKTDFGSAPAGLDLVLWPDRDGPGVRAMQAAGVGLRGQARTVRWIDPADLDLEAGGDAADLSVDGIRRAVRTAQAWHPPADVAGDVVSGCVRLAATTIADGAEWAVDPLGYVARDVVDGVLSPRWRWTGRGVDGQWWRAGPTCWGPATWEELWDVVLGVYMPLLRRALTATRQRGLSFPERIKVDGDGAESETLRSVWKFTQGPTGAEEARLRHDLQNLLAGPPPRRAGHLVPLPGGVLDLSDMDDPWRVHVFDPAVHGHTGTLALDLTTAELEEPPRFDCEWQQVLHELMPDDDELEYMEWHFGAAILKRTPKGFMYVSGRPDTGKSTLPAAVVSALGDLGLELTPAILERQPDERNEGVYQALEKDAAFVFLDDVQDTRVFLGQLKRITSRARMSVRKIYMSPIQGRFEGLLFCTGNGPFQVSGLDDAFAGRQRLVEWRRQVTAEQQAARTVDGRTLIDRLQPPDAGGDEELLKQVTHWLLRCAFRAADEREPKMPPGFMAAAAQALEAQDMVYATCARLQEELEGKTMSEIKAVLAMEIEDWEERGEKLTDNALGKILRRLGGVNTARRYDGKLMRRWRFGAES